MSLDGQLQIATDPAPSLDEPLLTAAAAASLLNVRKSWVYDAVRDGRLPSVRIGRHVRFVRSDLEHWVSDQRRPSRR